MVTAGCMLFRPPDPIQPQPQVLVITAGTSDIPVADEAVITLAANGITANRLHDVGVAGLHRLLAHLDDITSADAIIVIAGMEGALSSVIGGLTSCPVIAVPTSVGYGGGSRVIAPPRCTRMCIGDFCCRITTVSEQLLPSCVTSNSRPSMTVGMVPMLSRCCRRHDVASLVDAGADRSIIDAISSLGIDGWAITFKMFSAGCAQSGQTSSSRRDTPHRHRPAQQILDLIGSSGLSAVTRTQ